MHYPTYPFSHSPMQIHVLRAAVSILYCYIFTTYIYTFRMISSPLLVSIFSSITSHFFSFRIPLILSHCMIASTTQSGRWLHIVMTIRIHVYNISNNAVYYPAKQMMFMSHVLNFSLSCLKDYLTQIAF